MRNHILYMGVTYTAKEIATAEKLIQDWNANNAILQEIIDGIVHITGFEFALRRIKRACVHPLKAVETKEIARSVGQRLGELFSNLDAFLTIPEDYVWLEEAESEEHMMFCVATVQEFKHRNVDEFQFFNLSQRICLSALLRELDNLKANEVVIHRKIKAITEPKLYQNRENMQQVYLWYKECDIWVTYLYMGWKGLEEGTYRLTSEVKKTVLVDGELAITDVPIGTLVRDKCGCIYKHKKRGKRDSESQWDYDTDGMMPQYCELIQASKKCLEDRIYTRYGYKKGAHGRPIGYKGWTFDKTFSIVRYPDGKKQLKQPRARREYNVAENKDK